MMSGEAAAELVLLQVLGPALGDGSGGSAPERPRGLGAGRADSLYQNAGCKLQHLRLPAARPHLMVFRKPLRAGSGDPGRLRLPFPRTQAPSPPRSPACCPRQQERVCWELARHFGGFSVAGGGAEWAASPGWECPGPAASPSEEPADSSDAVLVLEAGLGGLEPGSCQPEAEAEAGAFQLPPEPDRGSPGRRRDSEAQPESPGSGCSPGPGSPCPAARVRLSRCSSSPSPSLADEKLLSRLPGKSRKNSLKIRLGKIFRTKSCSAEPGAKRHSMDLETSAGCLAEISQLQDFNIRSKPRLTRTQSAFTPVSLASPFTGETVSLVDLDISRRGPPSPHPPTPPPPPRRSLSLLDDIAGPQPPSCPVSPAAASLQLLPLPPPPPPPPPPHTSIQHSLSLNDTLQRNLPQIRPMTVQPQHCPLSRRDSNSFAASLRELEKCGWYWGPMNWDDAEMKLKGKPDGSFLVRDSSDPRYILSLSFRSQGITHHTRMEHYRGTFSLWCQPKFEDRCQSVVEFIERAIMHSKNGKFLYFLRSRVPGLPPTPVQLLYPVSRFSNVKSLQHLCRFRIRQLVRIDHIPELPLPKPLISYLRKFYYYDPEEEAYLSLREARLCIAHEQDMDTQT
ncbi:suppressor of cytokine signaling 7 isoform X2 [Mustelus asterias]